MHTDIPVVTVAGTRGRSVRTLMAIHYAKTSRLHIYSLGIVIPEMPHLRLHRMTTALEDKRRRGSSSSSSSTYKQKLSTPARSQKRNGVQQRNKHVSSQGLSSALESKTAGRSRPSSSMGVCKGSNKILSELGKQSFTPATTSRFPVQPWAKRGPAADV